MYINVLSFAYDVGLYWTVTFPEVFPSPGRDLKTITLKPTNVYSGYHCTRTPEVIL